MPTYKLRGIDVDFPFEAYECQKVYMEKVIEALQNRSNALLESPTGTGKTLCLLCATLAWRKSLGGFSTGRSKKSSQSPDRDSDEPSSQSGATNLPTIVYTTRTHSQLRQVIQELKRSNYRPKMVVLGSREQLCIHDKVSLLHGKAQTHACHFLCRKRQKRHCIHYPQVADYMKQNPHLGDEPVDIEDLFNIGRRYGPCPYYLSRELHKVVDILFAPYNYLIDRGNRKSLKLDWQKSIVIFDEAHNLESLCADAASFDLPSGLLTACISEAKTCIDLAVSRREDSNDKSRNPDNFAILRALLLKLEKRIAEVPIESKEFGFTKPGPYIYELLGDLNITHKTASKIINIIEEAAVLLEEDKQQKKNETACRLESFSDILNLIFRDKVNAHADFYRVHVQEAETKATEILKGKTSRTLSWWCFNPGITMQEFSRLGVGSIILTSGTLSPMDSFAQELKLDFPIRLENPHVISSTQIWAGVVPVGPSGYSFNSSYRNRDSLEYKQELGNAIVNFARIVPDGLLVFFPSYYILDQCIGCWKNMSSVNSTTIWERICKHKKPVIEPRQSSLFPLSIEDYMAKLKDTSSSGAIFFAVCRGKVSEGLDFADHAGRAVVVTGLPFPTSNDAKVRLKREYLDQQAQSLKEGCQALKLLTGEDWYNRQASRAVNQAVGRVIRHSHDYGAIILCDERFGYPNRQSQISRWIQPHLTCYNKFGEVAFKLTRFFRDGGMCSPTKLKLLENGNIADGRETKTAQPLDKSYSESFSTGLKPADKACSTNPISVLREVKRGNSSSQLGGILPANRSFLTPCKEGQASELMQSSGHGFKDKKSIPCGGNKQQKNHEVIDLIDDSLLDEKPSKEPQLVPLLTKKRKVLNIEHDTMQHVKNTGDHASGAQRSGSSDHPFMLTSVKVENTRTSDTSTMVNAKVHLLQKDEGAALADAKPLGPERTGFHLSTIPCGDEETKGSVFLIQVKEKLSSAEYKEFVGLMKALKSKTMKIGQVLQCIVRLFSEPERLPLLDRFKDYVPAKYQSLYEQYLKTNVESSTSKTRN
ncbi:hypothetical protein SLEP1_g50693 [Rubroshorea leprosula]|uniref:Regulator of telomere elongation helicase 1 homolog n=1 Tax=Rubroshorea leprosula TaxID=152421 RepID=A0AAV5M426_9ROSI|nr:hypothetical protein SLEP1_g50693 [Rubroshorea leprosula]